MTEEITIICVLVVLLAGALVVNVLSQEKNMKDDYTEVCKNNSMVRAGYTCYDEANKTAYSIIIIDNEYKLVKD